MTATITPPIVDKTNIQRIFKLQQANQFNIAKTSACERIAKLRKLEKALIQHRQAIRDAVYADFRKPATEVDIAEIYAVVSEIRHAIKNLRRWMSPQRVPVPIMLIGASSHIIYEPKGVVLVIAPWNFPLLLTLGPVASAIAAGNCVTIKPSELTPHTSALMGKLIREIFPENEVAIFEGDAEVAKTLLDLPFNHIFYTGSPAIGKVIMAAAAKNLASVTLELGGKSPTIIDETANLDLAVGRIAWSKFTNGGQACVAPDYVLVHERVKDAFVEKMQKRLQQFFSDNAQQSDSYTRIVNSRHFERIKDYVDEAVARGAKVVAGAQVAAQENYLAPTLLTDVPLDTKVMEEEIFGPVLPILSFKNLDEALQLINSKERPLALYMYSKNQQHIQTIIQNTRSGGVAINHSEVHFFNYDLPFGGVNNSGIGKAHGWFGFEAFSNARGVFRQNFWGGTELIMPPYNGFKQKIVDLLIKWF
ncbi:MAG: aldehyde dehydrogenase family protein [Saprospiraceae bacterium]